MCSALSYVSRAGQKGCNNFTARKSVPQVKLSLPLRKGCPQKQCHLLETFSVHKETAGPSLRVHTDQDGTSRSITVKGKEMRGVRKGRGENERTYISGEKRKRRTITSHQSHTPFGVPIRHPTGIFWKQKRH